MQHCLAGRYPRDVPGFNGDDDEARHKSSDTVLRDGVVERVVPRQGRRPQTRAEADHRTVRNRRRSRLRVRQHATRRH